MADQPNQVPDTRKRSGVASGSDPTTEPGQYPPTMDHGIFGGPLPSGTGAPGTQGGRGPRDETTEAGQLTDGLTGVTDSQISQTGAPGTGTSPDHGGGGSSISYTRPGSAFSGTYQADSVSDDLDGPTDSTQANDEGYGTGGPQLPGIKGNEPVPGGKFQPGSGNVRVGGRMNGQ